MIIINIFIMNNDFKKLKYFSLNLLLLNSLLLTSCTSSKKVNISLENNLLSENSPIVDVLPNDGDSLDSLLEDDFLDDFDDFGDLDDEDEERNAFDVALENYNVAMFTFNEDYVYEWVTDPVSDAYKATLPDDIRGSIGNFFNNLSRPYSIINSLLQGNFSKAGDYLSMFLIDSTLGVYGLGDPSVREFGFKRIGREDFGQTLGFWGVPGGPTVIIPLLGPSNVRDGFSLFVDFYADPYPQVAPTNLYYGATGVYIIEKNTQGQAIRGDIKKYTLDWCTATLIGYEQDREAKISNQK